MLDVVNYFIGAFHRLFFYVDNDWANDYRMRLAFVIMVGVMCGITLFMLFSLCKSALSALFNSLRGD